MHASIIHNCTHYSLITGMLNTSYFVVHKLMGIFVTAYCNNTEWYWIKNLASAKIKSVTNANASCTLSTYSALAHTVSTTGIIYYHHIGKVCFQTWNMYWLTVFECITYQCQKHSERTFWNNAGVILYSLKELKANSWSC